MSEQDGEKTTRDRLMDAAIRLLEAGGPEALQARKVAAELGASTMAVYTHFGGMPQLVKAMVEEGFRRLTHRLDGVGHTSDSLADLFALGLAYRAHALDNPQLYRLMFGLTTLTGRTVRKDMLESDGMPTDLAEGLGAFEYLVSGVRRVAESGRITATATATDADADPGLGTMAAQIWSLTHGYVLLEITGYLGDDGKGVEQIFLPLGINLAVGIGDDRESATASAQNALSRNICPGG